MVLLAAGTYVYSLELIYDVPALKYGQCLSSRVHRFLTTHNFEHGGSHLREEVHFCRQDLVDLLSLLSIFIM